MRALRLTATPCLAFAALALVATGCGEEASEDPGVLTLGWRVSPLGCEASGVKNVELHLDGLDDQPGLTQTWSCNAGRAILDGLLPGRYAFTLTGRDDAGRATFASPRTQLAVQPGRVTTYNDARLTARPGQVNVTWRFDNGHLCASNGIDHVFIGVYDADAYVMQETLLPCADGTGTLEGLPSGSFFVEVLGLAPDMTSLFRGIQEIQLERGDEASLDVTLQACAGACQP